MVFDEEVTDSLRQFIAGADAYILAGLTVTIWGTAYAVISLTTGHQVNALWIGLMIAILGMWALFSILIDYIEYRFDLTFTKTKQYLYRSSFVTILCALILLSVYRIIPPYIVLGPLDIITNNIFYILIIPIVTREVFDIITTKKYEYFKELKLDAYTGHKLEYVLLTTLTALIYGGFVMLYAAITRALDIVLTFLPIPILAAVLYVLILRMKVRKENTAPSFQVSLKLLMHIGVLIVLFVFFYRAWLLYNHEGHPEILEVVASSAIVVTGVTYSARRLRKMEFATPRTVSKYLFGLTALGIGGVVIAVLFTHTTSIGEFTVDTAMMYLYIAHGIGISLALTASIFKLVAS